MTGKGILFTLLFVWLFAIVAPPLLSCLQDKNLVVTNNLNEEEHGEDYPDTFKKEWSQVYIPDLLFFRISEKTLAHTHYRMGHSERCAEIFLPPPRIG